MNKKSLTLPYHNLKNHWTAFQNYLLRRKYHNMVEKQKKISCVRYLSLAEDIPISHFMPYEVYSYNAFYGNSYILKEYAGLPVQKELYVSIQHGADFSDFIWESELIPPVHFTWGKHTKKIFQERTIEPVYSIGAPFFYSKSLWHEETIMKERERLGRNLLVFPVHSSHFNLGEYDPSLLIDKISRVSEEFDSVRICLYWKDIQLGIHKHYEKEFNIVSAGHIFDLNFCSRLKSLMEICDATMGNSIGTHIGYSLFSKKPFLLTNDKITRKYLREDEPKVSIPSNNEYNDMCELFSQNDDFILNNEHYKIIEPFWGLEEIKEKNELLQYIKEADELAKGTNKD